MSKLDLLLEAERRGILPPDKAEMLAEARKRGLVEPVPRETAKSPSGYAKGLMDPINAVGQLVEKALPESVSGAITDVHNLAAKYGFGEPMPEGFDPYVRQKEAEYQAARQQAGATGVDWSRLAGNVLNPATLSLASRIPQAGGLVARMAQGAAGGAVVSPLTMPATTEQEFLSEKLGQAGGGAVGGFMMPAITSGLTRTISPKVDEAVKSLQAQGVKTTLGQRLGGMAKDIEDKAVSTPMTGKAIEKARERGYQDFNRAAINRALGPIGKELPEGTIGPKAIEHTRKELGKAYESVLGKMEGKIDDQFVSEFGEIMAMAESSLPEELFNVFRKKVLYETGKRVTQDGKITGKHLKEIQEGLRKQHEKFTVSQDAFQRELGDNFGDVLTIFNDMAARNNPKLAEQLKSVNKGYANFKRVQRAAAMQGAKERMFTPAQLSSAVRALDKSKDKAAFAESRALMQDLAEQGEKVLPSKVPDSGTAGRMFMNAPISGTLAGLMMSPLGLANTPFGGKITHGLLTARPQAAQPIANFIRQSTPFLIPGAGQGLSQ